MSAHVTLLRAEIGEIIGLVKQIAILAGIAAFLGLMMAATLYVGGFLFLGEWLFGSLGWGVAHGSLLALALIVMLGLAIVGADIARVLIALVVGVLASIGLALLLGSNVLFNTASAVAPQLVPPLNVPAAPSALVGAVVVGLVAALLLARAGGVAGAVVGLVVGGLVGAVLGVLLGGVFWDWAAAVGFAITIGLLLWSILEFALAWPTVDLEERFGVFTVPQSRESFAETREWLGRQWAKRRPSPRKR